MIIQDWRYDKDLDKEELRKELCALSEQIRRMEERLDEITRATS